MTTQSLVLGKMRQQAKIFHTKARSEQEDAKELGDQARWTTPRQGPGEFSASRPFVGLRVSATEMLGNFIANQSECLRG